jgi:hypothetical protein
VTGLLVPRVSCNHCTAAVTDPTAANVTELRARLRACGWSSYQQPGWTRRDRCPNCTTNARIIVRED